MTNPHDDRIRERAYAIWNAEGQPADRDVDHWLQAEREVGADPVDGPEDETASPASPSDAAGPDETVETISEDPKASIVTLAEPAPESVEAEN